MRRPPRSRVYAVETILYVDRCDGFGPAVDPQDDGREMLPTWECCKQMWQMREMLPKIKYSIRISPKIELEDFRKHAADNTYGIPQSIERSHSCNNHAASCIPLVPLTKEQHGNAPTKAEFFYLQPARDTHAETRQISAYSHSPFLRCQVNTSPAPLLHTWIASTEEGPASWPCSL